MGKERERARGRGREGERGGRSGERERKRERILTRRAICTFPGNRVMQGSFIHRNAENEYLTHVHVLGYN